MRPSDISNGVFFLVLFQLPLSDSSPTRGVLFGGWFFWERRQSGGMVSLSAGDPKPVLGSLLLLLCSGQALLFQGPKPPESSIRAEDSCTPAAIFLCSLRSHKRRATPSSTSCSTRGSRLYLWASWEEIWFEVCKASC